MFQELSYGMMRLNAWIVYHNIGLYSQALTGWCDEHKSLQIKEKTRC